MSLVRCRSCDKRCDGRPIAVYWAWFDVERRRHAYMHRLCTSCYAAKVLPLDVTYPEDAHLTCPNCHIDTDGEYDAMYTTSYPGKGPAVQTESPFCSACAAHLRIWVQEHADSLPDRDRADGPYQQTPTTKQTLQALGRALRPS
jgi:hypothetical protein